MAAAALTRRFRATVPFVSRIGGSLSRYLSVSSRLFRDGLLKGKVALVTGGGTGIGAACARELALLGAKVIIGSRKPENFEPAAAGLSAETGTEVLGVLLDIRDRAAARRTVDALVAAHGKIDVLVNNGGGQFMTPAEDISEKVCGSGRGREGAARRRRISKAQFDCLILTPSNGGADTPHQGWDAVVGTNLTGTWNLTRAVADASMLARGGRIINITMLTNGAFPGMAHSHAARAGVEAMTRTLAVEWASRAIRINAVAPGIVASSGLRRYPRALGIVERARGLVPAKRLATCEEVAWMVAYLAGPAGDYITGETIAVDGAKRLWGDTWPIADPGGAPPAIPREAWERDGGGEGGLSGEWAVRALESARGYLRRARSVAVERAFMFALRRGG